MVSKGSLKHGSGLARHYPAVQKKLLESIVQVESLPRNPRYNVVEKTQVRTLAAATHVSLPTSSRLSVPANWQLLVF